MSIAIHKVEDGYVFSEDSVWRPGCFESREAVKAARHLTDEQIQALQDAVAPNVITMASVVRAVELSRFFQDAAGTIPVTAVEQPVGLVR